MQWEPFVVLSSVAQILSYLRHHSEHNSMASITRVVAITGCDSGLGWALAARTARQGFLTVAGMYNGTNTEASNALRELCAHPHSLDVTKQESVMQFKKYVMQLLEENPMYKLYAVVNNAGVMTIADYEWQTQQIIEDTINVNLLGTMRICSAFLPELRKAASSNVDLKPRIINIASHCGLQPLPGFGPYSASKAGVISLTQSLRMENKRHGLSAVTFVPGGFVATSNLLSNQEDKTKQILDNLSEEQRSVHGKRIISLTNYLSQTQKRKVSYDDAVRNEIINETFMKALTEKYPKELYKVESWRYTFYYSLLKLPLPEFIRHWIIKKHLSFPED